MLLYSVYEKQLLAFFNRTVLMLTLGSNIFSPYVYIYITSYIWGDEYTHFLAINFFFSIIFGSLLLILLLSYAGDLCVCTDASVIVKNYSNFATHFFHCVYIFTMYMYRTIITLREILLLLLLLDFFCVCMSCYRKIMLDYNITK